MGAFRTGFIGVISLLGVAAFVACSSSTTDGGASGNHDPDGGPTGSGSAGGAEGSGGSSSGSGGSTGNGGGANGGGATGGFGGQTLGGLDGSVVTQICGGEGCACSNGKDDDGDGQIDGFDTECTGPLDNDEGSFATGIPGDNQDPKWQDCFFDGNSGAGDDGCRYATGCLTGELEQTDKDCKLTQGCVDYCGQLTPNGCDCFGCCTIGTGSGSVDVKIQGSCSVDKIDDETACPRCVKSVGCNNVCGECELCPGKTLADLPAKCTPPPPGTGGASGSGGYTGSGGAAATGGTTNYPPPPNTCDFGRTPCASTAACGNNEYCQQGCCIGVAR
jgi:hypothetical protein